RGLYRAVHAADSTLCAGRRCGRLLLLLDETLMAQRVLKTHSSDQVAHLSSDPRSPTRRAGSPSPVAGKTLAMPTHDSLGPDDAHGIQNTRVATIEPEEQGAVDPTQMQSTARRALLQDIELMPQYQDFGFQPRSRLEEVAQHTDEQDADRNHSAIMF